MKKILFTLLFIFSCTWVFAQNSDLDIVKNDFEKIIDFTKNKETEKILDMTYPRLFEVTSRDVMKAMMDSMMPKLGITISYEDIAPNIKLSGVESIEGTSFVLCKYNQNMTMYFQNPQFTELVLSEGKSMYPDYELKKIDSNSVKLDGFAYLMAVKDSYTDGVWRYLSISDNLSVLGKILSPQLLTEVAQLKTDLSKK